MIHAITHGKVSSKVKHQEDVLTSCVFGMLDTLPPDLGLGPWLRRAVNLAGDRLDVADADLGRAGPQFWPRFALGVETVEPDVLFDLGHSLLVVEAKYGAGPSGWPTEEQGSLAGQLGRQWAAIRDSDMCAGRPFSLVYLTAGWTMPAAEIEAMIAEVERDGDTDFGARLYWLSWRSLPGVLGRHSEPAQPRAADSLREYLSVADLGMFAGVSRPSPVSPPAWTYGYGPRPPAITIEWRYEP